MIAGFDFRLSFFFRFCHELRDLSPRLVCVPWIVSVELLFEVCFELRRKSDDLIFRDASSQARHLEQAVAFAFRDCVSCHGRGKQRFHRAPNRARVSTFSILASSPPLTGFGFSAVLAFFARCGLAGFVVVPPGKHRLLFGFAEVVANPWRARRPSRCIAHGLRLDRSSCGLRQLSQELGHAIRDLMEEFAALCRLVGLLYFAPVDCVALLCQHPKDELKFFTDRPVGRLGFGRLGRRLWLLMLFPDRHAGGIGNLLKCLAVQGLDAIRPVNDNSFAGGQPERSRGDQRPSA